jgi:hypothetical protein
MTWPFILEVDRPLCWAAKHSYGTRSLALSSQYFLSILHLAWFSWLARY